MIGYDSTFEVEDAPGSGVFVELAECTDITPPSSSVDDVEVTHMKSPDRTKEYIAGLTDAGEGSMGMNWVPGSDTDNLIIAWRADGTRRAARITYPNNVRWTFLAYVKTYSGAVPVKDRMSATLAMKIAGSVGIDTAA
jgi:hypothetical protein